MKLIKKTNEFVEKCRLKFEEYLTSSNFSDKIKFEYDLDSDTDNIVKPTIIFSQLAWLKIKTLVSKATGEIGWNGVVHKDNNTYTITDILVYPQKVTGATVTCDEIETGNWLATLTDEQFNNLRFQGHSHVDMGITPSSTDNTMFEKYLQTIDDNDFYIFLIINKKEDMYLELYDKSQNIIFYKKDIDIQIEGMIDFWEEAKKQVTNQTYTQPSSYNPTTQYYQGHPSAYKKEYEECDKKTCKGCKEQTKCLEYYMSRYYEKDDSYSWED